jgi:cadmium resistance protein CadD (predicted permease)
MTFAYYAAANLYMQTILTSILAFISTNIDDIFILMLFFGSRKFKDSTIILGQYTGIGSLVVISLAGSVVGNFIDQRYVGLLGLFPIYLALKGFLGLLKHDKSEDNVSVETTSTGIISIAGVTIANGGDNIGVYVPLLTTMSNGEKIEMIFIFGVMTYLWCIMARYLSSRPLIANQIDKFGHVIMPVVLLLLGVFIIVESGSLSLIPSGLS